MFGKQAELLALVCLSLMAASQGSSLELETIVTRLIVKENSPLCLSLEFYELDQVVIIQQHVDTVSIEMYQVYVRFTVVATCKPNGPQSCEDQMRLCNAQFNLNGSDVNDDICKCAALPDIQFGLEPHDEDNVKINGIQNKTKSAAEKPNGSLVKMTKAHPAQKENKNNKGESLQKGIGSLPEKNLRTAEVAQYRPNQRESNLLENNGRALIKEDTADPSQENEKNALVKKNALKKKLKPSTKKINAETLDNGKHPKQEAGGSLNSIELLMFIQSAVEAANDASSGKLKMTLSKILRIDHQSEASGSTTYSLKVECSQLSDVHQRCDITCKPEPSFKEQAVLLRYACHPVVAPPKRNDKLVPASNKKPSQAQLIAEYAAIQMDVIDADDYRRVILQVTSVREQITMDGSSLLYSLSVVMVSTSCEETKHLNDQESQSCLDHLMSPPQTCNIDCVRPCTSDDPPQLVNSECAPIL